MSSAFDPLNLIILAVAVVVLWRLRSVLGTRTGHERRYDPFPPAETGDKRSLPTGEDKVIPMPGRKPAEAPRPVAEAEPEPVWKGVAPEGSALAQGLEAIAAEDPEFKPREFLEGAKIAYEMIVTAFAEGDLKALKSLLTPVVYEGFEDAIAAREKAGETLESKLVGIDGTEIVGAALDGRRASVTVKFRSQTIRATRDAKGEVIDGDPLHVDAMTDVWTFERDIRSSDPNWSLADTEETA
ncbi:MAG: Tim44/TimA family putative adaptor protein [Parvibaculaceae bacterium]